MTAAIRQLTLISALLAAGDASAALMTLKTITGGSLSTAT